MKRIRRVGTGCLAAVLLLPSCSSIGLTLATWPNPRAYKGTQYDISVVANGRDLFFGWFAPVIGAIDLPLSLVMDTVLLPVNLVQWALLEDTSDEGDNSIVEQSSRQAGAT